MDIYIYGFIGLSSTRLSQLSLAKLTIKTENYNYKLQLIYVHVCECVCACVCVTVRVQKGFLFFFSCYQNLVINNKKIIYIYIKIIIINTNI